MNRREFLSGLAAVPLAADALASTPFLPAGTPPQGKGAVDASMWIYLWDIQDEGFAPALRRLKESGLNALSMATAYHAGKFLLPHNPKRKVYFPEDGTVYFEPAMRLYGSVRPVASTLARNGEGLPKVRRIAAELGLETRAWVVCCHNTPLGIRHPEIAVRNVFGDPLPHNLCPASPDLRTYLNALVKDIAGNGVRVIELEALRYQGYTHGFHHEREGIPLTPAAQFLLGLCFCEACVKGSMAAGVDTDRVRGFAKSALDEYLRDPQVAAERLGAVDSLPMDLLDPMLRWRRSVVEALLEQLAATAAASKAVVRPMVSLDATAARLSGLDPVAARAIAGSVIAMGYVKDGPALTGLLAPYLEKVPAKDVTVGFQVGLPESGGKAEFDGRYAAARALGVERFNFYNYGFIPLERLAWVKEAVGS